MNPISLKQNLMLRLWQYQKERFPLFKHGVLILSFSFCAVCLSSLLRNDTTWPNLATALTSFICLLLFFLQLRIADEFKDLENDTKYRPERPVPRGLVNLTELKWIGIASAVIQLFSCYLLYPPLIILLILVWAYLALMSVEFFIPDWLRLHPFTYMWTHMLIMPLIDLFATGCDWLPWEKFPSNSLIYFLLISFFNGIVIEIGRKTWAPSQERHGVETYSADWGISTAIYVWLAVIIMSFICALIIAAKINFFAPVLITLVIIASLLIKLGISFIKSPTPKKSKRLENASGLWVAGLYLILGIIPMGYYTWLN